MIVRRQARGERRIAQILDAAAAVFARDGVARATTNAIAGEAGISPGSLYQFFRDKQAIVEALGRRYAVAVAEVHQAAFADLDPVVAPLAETIDHVVDPIVEFKNRNRAFLHLFARTDVPPALASPSASVDLAFAERIAAILRARNPDLRGDDADLTAHTLIAMLKGAMLEFAGLDDRVGEVKVAMLGYLHRKGLG